MCWEGEDGPRKVGICPPPPTDRNGWMAREEEEMRWDIWETRNQKHICLLKFSNLNCFPPLALHVFLVATSYRGKEKVFLSHCLPYMQWLSWAWELFHFRQVEAVLVNMIGFVNQKTRVASKYSYSPSEIFHTCSLFFSLSLRNINCV